MDSVNLYREAIAALDWGHETAFVIGHKTPDGDSVMSALAYAHLMQKLGFQAEPRMAGQANKETHFAAKAFGFDLPPIMDHAEQKGENPCRLILMDHSDYAQAVDGARESRILQVIDHHGIGDILESKLIYGKYMPVGSTCTIVYTSYLELGVEITEDVAKILLAGILADTLNLVKVTCTAVDKQVYQELVSILAQYENRPYNAVYDDVQKIYKGMYEASKNFEGMTDEEIFNSDAKDYNISGVKFRLGSLDWNDDASILTFLDRMLAVMENISNLGSMAFCRIGYQEHSYILYCGESAEKVAEKAFGKAERRGVVYCEKRLSRKLDVVPMLTAALTNP